MLGTCVVLTACEQNDNAGTSTTELEPQALKAFVGKNCTVQFRRDWLGMTAVLPVSPTTNSINGAEVSIYGKLDHIDNDWIALDLGKRVH